MLTGNPMMEMAHQPRTGFITDRCERFPENPADKNSFGFTLMEVLVALAVVSIALLAVYRMHSQTLFMNHQSRFDTTATLLAGQKLAEINNPAILVDLTTDEGEFGETYPGYTWKIEGEIVASDLFREEGPVLKRIRLTIRYEETSEFTLTTYRHLYE